MDNPNLKKEPDPVDDALAARQKGIKQRMMEEGLGISRDPGNSLPAALLTHTIDKLDSGAQRSADEAKAAREAAEKKQAENDRLLLANQETKDTFAKEVIGMVRDDRDKERAARERAEAAATSKKSELEQLADYQAVLDAQVEKRVANMPKPEERHGMSDSVAVELKKLELESARLLHQMSEDAAERARKFELEIAQLKDNREFKLMEYQDKKDFRKDGMEGLKSLVSAVDQARREEAIAKGAGETVSNAAASESAGAAPAPPPSGGETGRSATLMRFPCAACGEKIDVPDVEADQVVDCPGCHAEYEVPKEGKIQRV